MALTAVLLSAALSAHSLDRCYHRLAPTSAVSDEAPVHDVCLGIRTNCTGDHHAQHPTPCGARGQMPGSMLPGSPVLP
jgi:hypothetical protein